MTTICARYAFILVITVAMVQVLSGCAATRPTLEWRDSAYAGGPFNRVLIIGVTEDAATRRIFEDTFVSEFKKTGTDAVASWTLMPGDEAITKETVKAAIVGKGFDGVFVTHLLGIDEKTVYNPPTHYPSYAGYHSYYSHARRYVSEPGYYTKYKVARLESNLYETQSESLVWSMQSEAVEPERVRDVIESLSQQVIERLQRQVLVKG